MSIHALTRFGTRIRPRTGIRLPAVLAAITAMLLLAGCTGLPTSGPPNAGLTIGEDEENVPFTPIAQGPEPGADPEQIVAGFLDASMTPANSWEIARQFLTEEFSHTWQPEAGVAIDSSAFKRQFDASVDADEEDATTAEVRVTLDQVASVSADGVYSAEKGTAKAPFRLVRAAGGEWRIAEARDGVTLDLDTFGQVYEKFALQYFDPSWTHLVPDVRWFPRRPAMATSIVRTLISGQPSDWLAPAVRTAFSSDIDMVGDAVTVDAAQVASVSLTRAALSASTTDLARMRTQLEQSLVGSGVTDVRLVVDGVPLEAGVVSLDEPIIDPGVLVLTGETFGTAAAGGEIAPITGLTAQIAKIGEPIAAIDVSTDALLASVQLRDGRVFAVSDGDSVGVDERGGLIAPTLDPFKLIWTVPARSPGEVRVSRADAAPRTVAKAWPGAESISQMRVSSDGARVAAVVTSNGERRVEVASILRDADQTPLELGPPHEVGRLIGPAQGLSWVGADTVAVLSAAPDAVLTMHVIGGPAAESAAPDGAISVAGAKTVTGLRVLASDGAVYAQRGSFWQESISDVLVLGTRAGY